MEQSGSDIKIIFHFPQSELGAQSTRLVFTLLAKELGQTGGSGGHSQAGGEQLGTGQ